MGRAFAWHLAVSLAWMLSTEISALRAQEFESPPKTSAPDSDMGSLMRLGISPQTPMTILSAPAVQRELKLTEAQKAKIVDQAIAASQKQREVFRTMLFNGEANPQATLAVRLDLRQENDQAVAQLLETKQRERLDQIILQVEGPLSVGRPDVASRLRINEAQAQAVNEIMLELEQRQAIMVAQARQGAKRLSDLDPTQFTKTRAMTSRIRDAAVQRVNRILDRRQRAQFTKMLGPAFNLAELNPDKASADGKTPAEATKDDTKASDPPGEKPTSKTSRRPARKKARTKNNSGP
jgi:hypothetical protein